MNHFYDDIRQHKDNYARLAEIPEISKSFCYVLLKPDVVLRNIIEQIFKYFSRIGFDLIDYRCGLLPEYLYNKMYETAFHWKLDFWSHNAKAYNFGPVIGVMFWDLKISSRQSSAQNYLRSIKGTTLPEQLKQGTLRAQFKATSRVYNVLHVPDSVSQALAEASSWFGEKAVHEILIERVRHTSVTPREYTSLVEKEIRRHGYLLDRMLDGQASFALIKIRLLHAIRKQINPTSPVLDILFKLEDSYYELALNLLEFSKNKDNEDRRKHFIDSNFCLEKIYLNHLMTEESEFTSETLTNLLQVMLDLYDEKKSRLSTIEFFWHAISKWGVYTSELERYIINTALIYPTI